MDHPSLTLHLLGCTFAPNQGRRFGKELVDIWWFVEGMKEKVYICIISDTHIDSKSQTLQSHRSAYMTPVPIALPGTQCRSHRIRCCCSFSSAFVENTR